MADKILLVLSSPSGGGKSTVARHLLVTYDELNFSVSATTRSMRPGEKNGKEYFFLPKQDFINKISENKLVEYEEIFGNYYGTLRSEVDKAILNSKPLLFDIDVKGALSIKKAYPNESLLVFIAPPSLAILEQRLRSRNTESDEQIKNRLSRAEFEIALSDKFDYVIVNSILDETLKNIDEIFLHHFR